MPTNEERREVARKLRELEKDVFSLIDVWDEEGIFIICQDQADYYQIHFALMGCIPSVHNHPCDYAELHERLADLIDPDTTTDTINSPELTTKCDRDALLALADEMDEVAQRRRSMGYEGFAIGDEDRARRIREALGVTS